jgi:hypothetical protein
MPLIYGQDDGRLARLPDDHEGWVLDGLDELDRDGVGVIDPARRQLG